MIDQIYIACDNFITYDGARDAVSGSYLNSGTCTYAIFTDASPEVAVSGGTGTLDYVAASNGTYRAIVDTVFTAALTDGSNYILYITFVQGNYNDKRRLVVPAKWRGEF